MQKIYKLEPDETPQSLRKNIQTLEKECIYEYVNSFIENKKQKK